ncbi:MAG: NrsF family protein, partial [Burkholderiales bacterium]
MRTEALIELLAGRVAPVPRHAARRQLRLTLAAGLLLSFAIMLALLGIRPDLMHAVAAPMFWIKLL